MIAGQKVQAPIESPKGRFERVVDPEEEDDGVRAFVELVFDEDAVDVGRLVLLAGVGDQRAPIGEGRVPLAERDELDVAPLVRHDLAQLVRKAVRFDRRIDDGLVPDQQNALSGAGAVDPRDERGEEDGETCGESNGFHLIANSLSAIGGRDDVRAAPGYSTISVCSAKEEAPFSISNALKTSR